MLVRSNLPLNRIVSGTWRAGLIVLLTCVVAFAVDFYLLKKFFEFPAMVPTVLGTALAFFIGFNNNQAYGRWWEGRIIWGGLVNESRTWARLCVSLLGDDEVSRRFVRRQIAFIYALKDALRDAKDGTWRAFLPTTDVEVVAASRNRHNFILLQQARELRAVYAEKRIDGYQLLEFERTLSNITNEMGRAERIKSTVFPSTYNFYTYYFVFIFMFSATSVMASSIGAWSIVFGFLLGYVFLTIHIIGRLLLNPFENIPTGLALDQISRNIEINLLEMLGEKDLPAPITPTKDFVM